MPSSAQNCFFFPPGRESYCPHYERDTCLIHFKCCPEEKWYPCHKCHNAAVNLIENPNDKAEENDIPLDHIASNNMASENSDVTEERSSIDLCDEFSGGNQ